MDYNKIYYSIINKARPRGINKRNIDGYYEWHHIIPKCLGGSNNNDNYVLLTAREHFIAHILLHKIYPDNNGLLYAVIMNSVHKKIDNSHKYEKYRLLFRRKQSERLRIENPSFREDVKEKLRISSSGRTHSIETKLLMSKNHFKTCSEEHKRNLALVSIGRHWYHDPNTLEHRKFRETDTIPSNFIKGRKYVNLCQK